MPDAYMYDSTNVDAIPADASLILVYIDGIYQTAADARARFPHATLVPTTTQAKGSLSAQIYDCERGDGNAVQAALWAAEKLFIHSRPTIYCSRIGSPGYGWPDVQRALTAIGIGLNEVDFGIADYTYTPHLLVGSAFTQYTDPPRSGGDYDISLTNGVWPNVPPPTMLNKPACAMVETSTGKGYWICAQDGGVFSFGDAPFHGSLPGSGITPAALIVSMTATLDNGGYRLLGADGGVFCFGNAAFYGGANT